MSNKYNIIPNDEVIDLSSEEDIERFTNPEAHAKKNLPKATIHHMFGKSEDLLKLIPDSPAFLKGIQSGGFKQNPGLFGFIQKGAQKKLDIAVERSRSKLNEFLENQTKDPRKDLKRYLDKYETSPDLQSLWAIYLFNISRDFSDSKNMTKTAIARMDEDRLKKLKKALQGLMSAIFSDCITIYYTTWFIQVYNEYLITLNRLLKYNYSIISQEVDKRFAELVRTVYQGQKRVASMILKKDELESFSSMTRAITGSSYALLNLAPSKIKETMATVEKPQERELDVKVSANNTMTMLMSVLTLYARIPAFSQKNLVQNLLKQMPDLDEELEMRKQVILLTEYVATCKLAYAVDDLNMKRAAMKSVYKYAVGIADNLIKGSIPSKWHANIILRIGWVAINSKDDIIFPKMEYQQVLKKAYQYLGWIVSNCTIPTQPKGNENRKEDKIRQSLINQAIQSRTKIAVIGKTVDLALDAV
ncbi:hypothetical protein KKI24_16240 [bacterium]|nr:hypothetical protein [bacterium]